MPILVQKISSILSSFNKQHINDEGFSLIEILVALLLASLLFLIIPSSDSVQNHRDLKTAVDNIDRAIRFAMNETVLRNSVVRLHLDLDKVPVEYIVEYGPPGNFPLPEVNSRKDLSLEEEALEKTKKNSIDLQFNSVEEFQDIKHEIPESVSLVGVGIQSQNNLMSEGKANIYFYPTGDKDGALLLFSTREEIATLEVAPFLSDSKVNFYPLNIINVDNSDEIIQTKVEELFKEWISE